MATAFWGLQILPNKTYTQVIEGSFRVSMATFGEEVKGKQRSCLTVVVDEQSYVLCSLTPNKVEQQPLDIIFTEGEEITFSATGENTIHLTGNYLPEDDEMDFDEEDMEDLDEFDSEEEDDEISGRIEEIESEEEEEEEEEEEVKPVPAKKRKQENGAAPEVPKKKAKEEKIAAAAAKIKEAKQAKELEASKPKVEEKKAEKKAEKKVEEKKAAKAESATKTLPGGLIINDKVVGNGAVAKKGSRIGMRYIGRLTNGKVFDQNSTGKPFWFRLGAGEVISGWDKGIVGMKVGGERHLTIPAPLAYGKRGAPPDIPGNATLVFEVKLVQIK
ncbi:peptidylprolyl isomerase fpr3 [Basidiobolus ranarum]|uniref:peptidylprolyl isomerase n=1 Tax=Basidiobolus ranarum TaxID=34480 RepID=A0ABR2VXZ8_9FUNG